MKCTFMHRPDRQYHYETHIPLKSFQTEVYGWCWRTFGHPGQALNEFGNGSWDSHGGWIKLRGEEELVIFKLRWS